MANEDMTTADYTGPGNILADRRALLGAIGGVAAGAFLAGNARAGELTPSGAPAPTMKPLNHVEPRIPINHVTTPGDSDNLYRITQSGSYYLTNNIVGDKAKHGIAIMADSVTIDMMGFRLAGVADSLNGIWNAGLPRNNIRIINGSVTNWAASGISLLEGSGFHLYGIHASNNSMVGMRIADNGIIDSCSATSNTFTGIVTLSNAAVTNCVGRDNSGAGISIGNASTISNCNATGNAVNGISAGTGSSIFNCSARQNASAGIIASSSTVANCMATNNEIGISAGGRALVSGCMCANNSGAGIRSHLFLVRIEGNHCTENAQGILVTGSRCFIVRNLCGANTVANWDIAVNNKVGTIVNAPNSGVIVGNTGGVGVGSTDPWANFTY